MDLKLLSCIMDGLRPFVIYFLLSGDHYFIKNAVCWETKNLFFPHCLTNKHAV